ncbi:MAG: hypothetical protein AVDCRST_MAG78-2619 [uncultured Rubrobacteraceae bacterium]|uniref:Uncharacterized protein n=1 Tax=uncultured Rubrobacteraceae bacterium TaxID=349277 RepID=A0A6J4QJ36_9ACTN|nr:MAG: hypothetical protein AVDCRST_MAG78-2619 [uncultured Rubrobacteraceae bacterium]
MEDDGLSFLTGHPITELYGHNLENLGRRELSGKNQLLLSFL